ncbi:MAG: efflux RND transporter periplasmic adaptor subunit [Bacteroidota bacterium]
MKIVHILLFASLIFGLAACGEGEKEPKTVAEKEAKIKSLREEMAALQTQITTLEGEIQAESGENPEDALRRITALPLQKETFKHFIKVQGNVSSDENVLVNPEMSGTIIAVNVKEGDRVGRGQTLLQLDDGTLDKSIAELEARLTLAKQTYDRQKNLWDQKIGTEMQYLQAKNNVEVLEKNIESIQEQRSKTFVKAPINGTINEVMVNQGELANPAMPIARIVNLSKVKVEAEVSEKYLPSLRRGDKVTINFPVLNESREAKIDFVGDYIDERNRTFKVQVSLSNPDKMLKPNIVAMVEVNDLTKEDAVTVPTNLIQQATDGTKFVWTVVTEEGKKTIKRRNIKPGISYEGRALIEEGLDGTETLVNKGYNEVTEGEEVVILEEEKTENVASLEE